MKLKDIFIMLQNPFEIHEQFFLICIIHECFKDSSMHGFQISCQNWLLIPCFQEHSEVHSHMSVANLLVYFTSMALGWPSKDHDLLSMLFTGEYFTTAGKTDSIEIVQYGREDARNSLWRAGTAAPWIPEHWHRRKEGLRPLCQGVCSSFLGSSPLTRLAPSSLRFPYWPNVL